MSIVLTEVRQIDLFDGKTIDFSRDVINTLKLRLIHEVNKQLQNRGLFLWYVTIYIEYCDLELNIAGSLCINSNDN